MESTQVLIIVVVTILAIILAAVGIQIFFILKEVRRSVEKVNKMLDDATVVSGSVAQGVTGISGVLAGVKTGLSFLNFFKKGKGDEDGEEE